MLSFCLWLLFIILLASFQVQISLIYPFLAYMVSTYCLPSNTGFILQGNEDFSLMFSSRSFIVLFSSVQWLSHVWLFASPWTAACQASLSITNSQSLLKLMSIALVMQSNHLILSCPLLLPPSIFPSIRVFSKELLLRIRWPKY